MRLKFCPKCQHYHMTKSGNVVCSKCRAVAKFKADPNHRYIRKLRAAGVNV